MSNKKKLVKPSVNEKLGGFEVSVNSLGEINSTLDIDKINQFLNENVEDKKLTDRKEKS